MDPEFTLTTGKLSQKPTSLSAQSLQSRDAHSRAGKKGNRMKMLPRNAVIAIKAEANGPRKPQPTGDGIAAASRQMKT